MAMSTRKTFCQIIDENDLGHSLQVKHFLKLQLQMTQGIVHKENIFQIKHENDFFIIDENDLGYSSQEKHILDSR